MKLYIGGISPEVTENELQDLYSQFGKIKKVDLLKDETGTNRGYAFIEMENDMDAEAAILGTHNTLIGGANIQVSISRSRLDQKRDRQKKRPAPFKKTERGNAPVGPRKPSNFRPRRSPYTNSQENTQDNGNIDDRYNRKSNPIQKGLDYGRTSSSPQMSFLGQEGFATSLRTVDPLHSSKPNPNYKRNEGSNNNYYRKNNNTGRVDNGNSNTNNRRTFQSNPNYNSGNSSYNRRGPSNYKKSFDNEKAPEDSSNTKDNNDNQIFKKNTSDIIGNLE